MITSAERNAVEAAIARARLGVAAAHATAQTSELTAVAERLEWALDFVDAALEKLSNEQT